MAQAGSRSLKTALFEAGLGDRPDADTRSRASKSADHTTATAEHVGRPSIGPTGASPDLGLFKDLNRQTNQFEHSHGVVSPPPWVRAAQRGRRHTRLMNTLGWVMTLIVAGTFIGVASRYLAVQPIGLENVQARQ